MSEPVKIMMYRTPAEMALWEGGLLWPIMASTFWAFILCLAVLWLCKTFVKRDYRADYIAVATLIIGFIGCLKLVYGVI